MGSHVNADWQFQLSHYVLKLTGLFGQPYCNQEITGNIPQVFIVGNALEKVINNMLSITCGKTIHIDSSASLPFDKIRDFITTYCVWLHILKCVYFNCLFMETYLEGCSAYFHLLSFIFFQLCRPVCQRSLPFLHRRWIL